MLANRFGLLQANTSTFFFLIVSNLNLLSLRSDWSVIGKLRKQILGIQFLYKLEWRCDRGRLRALVNYSYFVCGCTCFTDCWDLIKTHAGNPSELVICIEPEPLQSKMELLPTNFLLHIQHFLSPALLSRFVFQHERNDSYLQFFLEEISVPIMISISCL